MIPVVHVDARGVNLTRGVVKSGNESQNTLTCVEHQVVPSGWSPYTQSAQELWVTFICKECTKFCKVTGAHIIVYEGEDTWLAGGGSSGRYAACRGPGVDTTVRIVVCWAAVTCVANIVPVCVRLVWIAD